MSTNLSENYSATYTQEWNSGSEGSPIIHPWYDSVPPVHLWRVSDGNTCAHPLLLIHSLRLLIYSLRLVHLHSGCCDVPQNPSPGPRHWLPQLSGVLAPEGSQHCPSQELPWKGAASTKIMPLGEGRITGRIHLRVHFWRTQPTMVACSSVHSLATTFYVDTFHTNMWVFFLEMFWDVSTHNI